MPPTKVSITGDFFVGHNIYADAARETRHERAAGGAWIVRRLLEEMKTLPKAAPIEIIFPADDQDLTRKTTTSHALWEPRAAVGPDGKLAKLWRMSRSLGIGPAALEAAEDIPRESDVIVIDDAAAGFRYQNRRCPWPDVTTGKGDKRPWLLLKTVAPLFQGRLWHELMGAEGLADRLIVLLAISDLRREEVRVSRAISWERTAEELVRELKSNPGLAGLRRARNVLVSLDSEGCLWTERAGNGWSFRLLFDPRHMEGEWATAERLDGEVHGDISCLTASLALELAEPQPNMERALRAGLRGMRRQRQLGHGLVGDATPGMPYAELAKTILETKERDREFVSVNVPHDGQRWHMLEGTVEADDEPLYGIAKRVAIFGPNALVRAPFCRFGKLATADRDEIEALRNIRRLISDYSDDKNAAKPLALAVFGPPGAGKSFGIKQIAAEVLGAATPFLEFNLSQSRGMEDLIGAFHQVRDKVLEGKTPVVFWDEFDSRFYELLQFFLAPMQDGKFQEGQITHPLGKCVFVFAGATSYDMENFGPRKSDTQAYRQFVLRKGPDFISRISGYLNVLGPNRRQNLIVPRDQDSPETGGWVDDESDVCFPVRRALILRTLLGVGDRRLDIDRGLLAALLETKSYKYGARSFEKAVAQLSRDHGTAARRGDLPTNEILALNVDDVSQFLDIVTRAENFQQFTDKLAPAVHDIYRQLAKEEGWQFKYDMEFKDLPAEIKADNVAAAHRIPWILELAGLFLAPKEIKSESSDPRVGETLERLLNILAEEEHDLWVDVKRANGWRQGEKRDDNKLIHNCLVPYRDLRAEDQKKDQNSVCNFPRIVELAGFKIVVGKPKAGN